MLPRVVLVHGIRTSRTMWRSQLEYLAGLGIEAEAIDLPGHGARMSEPFTLAGAFASIDAAVREAADHGPVLLVGHSMGGLLATEYLGGNDTPPVAAYIGASCTALPRGAGLSAYRFLARRLDSLPDRGQWLSGKVLDATLPTETRHDYGAGGYALDAQDSALAALADLDLEAALPRITCPTWWINGQFDQLRVNERLFTRLVPQSELIVVPRTSHLVTAMRPDVFNALLKLAVATIVEREEVAAGVSTRSPRQ